MGKYKEVESYGVKLKMRKNMGKQQGGYCLCRECIYFRPHDPSRMCHIVNEVRATCKEQWILVGVWGCARFEADREE